MDIVGLVRDFIYYTWFIWAFFILLPIALEALLAWRQKVYEHHLDWAMLEILIPREIVTSPKAMEQVLAQLYAFKNYPSNPHDKWITGEVTHWHSFEIAFFDGQIHFFLRTLRKFKNITEAALYAYYPDLEIIEVEDYMNRFPKTVQDLYVEGQKMWGAEITLEKSSVYPILDYTEFESPDENKQYDPMSGFIETLSKLQPDQFAAIQILAWPATPDDPHNQHAMHEYYEEIKEMRDRAKEEHGHGHGGGGMKLKFHGILPNLEPAGHEEEDLAHVFKKMTARTPGETDTLKAMEDNISRPLFNTVIRYIYVSPFDKYGEEFPIKAIPGSFAQYSAMDLNAFKINWNAAVRGKIWDAPYVYPEIRKEFRRQGVWYNFRHREIPPHTWLGKTVLTSAAASQPIQLSIRSLATIWHPPTYATLTGPHIHRVESRKAGPPAGIEIFGDEDQISKFQ